MATPTKTPTPARERLTRERVIVAALKIMDEEGLEAVTMRRVGRDLGVEAMSLYNHVQDKEDILDGICEAVMAEFEFPPDGPDTIEAAREGARAWRRLLQRHPNVIQLFAERHHPMTSVDSLRPMEFALDTLRKAGLSPSEAAQAFQVFGGYIMGFVMLEQGKMFGPGSEEHARMHEERMVGFPAHELPRIAEMMTHLAECDADAQFEFGLDLLLDGLQAKTAESAVS